MKKNIYLASLFCGLMALITSCDNPGDPQFENDKFSSVLYLKNSGQVEVEFYNVNEDITYTTAIGKGGTNASIARSASLNVFTQEEMDTYNEENATNFAILPAQCYEFTKDYSFEGQTESQTVNITLKANIGALDESKQYALPLKLTSPDYGVNENKQDLLLIPNVITPKISLNKVGKQDMISISVDNPNATSLSIGTVLNMPNNGWSFSVNPETDENILKTLVDQYTAQAGGSYELLPATNYSLSELTFTGTENQKDLEISISNKDLLLNNDYLLPIVLSNCTGMPFDVDSENICYVHIRVTAELVPINLEGKLSTNDTSTDAGNKLSSLLDDNPNTVWQSTWHKAYLPSGATNPPCDPTYGIYIDVKNINITQIMQLKIATSATNNYPTEWSIYVMGADNQYKLLRNYTNSFNNTPTEFTTEEFLTECTSIRIAFLRTKNVIDGDDLRNITWGSASGWGSNCRNVGICDLKLYGY